jgi:hypothetical protein
MSGPRGAATVRAHVDGDAQVAGLAAELAGLALVHDSLGARLGARREADVEAALLATRAAAAARRARVLLDHADAAAAAAGL